jgi:hypothetical protein
LNPVAPRTSGRAYAGRVDPDSTPARIGLATRAQDRPGDTIRIVSHLSIPEPKHPQAVPPEVGLAPRIVLDLIGMDPAVELHGQPGLETEEVHDERPDRHLPAPLPAVEAARA